MDQYRGKSRPWYVPEVEYEGLTENGYWWEQLTFGGVLAPVNNDFSIKYGMSMYAFEDRYKSRNDPSRKFYSVPMSYIELIQQQKFWDNLDNRKPNLTTDQRWKFFHIDKQFAAKAYGQPYVCTAERAEAHAERWEKFWAAKDRRLKREAYNKMTQEQKDNVTRLEEAEAIERLRKERHRAWELRQKLVAQRKMNRHLEANDREYRLRLFETIQEPAEQVRRRPGTESEREDDASRGRSRSPRRSPPIPPNFPCPPAQPLENVEVETEEERARREYAWEEHRLSQRRQRDRANAIGLRNLEAARKFEREARQRNEYRNLVTGDLTERDPEPPRPRGMWLPPRTRRDRDMDNVSDLLESWLLPRDVLLRNQNKIEPIVVPEDYDEETTDMESSTGRGSDVTMTAPRSS